MAIHRKHAGEQDFELNLASIIDCFTVLITYLLVSASFISIGMFDVTVPILAAPDEAPPETRATLSISLKADRSISVALTGADHAPVVPPVTLPAKDGKPDTVALAASLESMATTAPADLDTKTLTALLGVEGEDIEYQEIVSTIEAVKPRFPNVVFGESGEERKPAGE